MATALVECAMLCLQHQTLLREVHVFDGAVQELMREVVSVNIQVGKEEEGRRAAAEEQRRRQEEERERRRKV